MNGLLPGRILLAYDGTSSARRALRRAAALHRDGDEIAVIYVSEDGDDRDGHVDEGRRLLADRGIDARAIVAAGQAAHAICVTAERDGYDTIVVGRRNPRDAGRLLLGRVAGRVVDGAHCDVIVVAL